MQEPLRIGLQFFAEEDDVANEPDVGEDMDIDTEDVNMNDGEEDNEYNPDEDDTIEFDEDETLEEDFDDDTVEDFDDDTTDDVIEDEDGADTATTESDPKASADTTVPTKADDNAEQIKKQMAEINKHLKTLKEYGIETDNILDGLDQLAAINQGISVEEYRKQKSSEDELEQAKKIIAEQKFQSKWQSDLAVLQSEFEECKNITKHTDIPNINRFFELRDMGLSPKEAYLASSGVRSTASEAYGRQKALNEQKAHLTSNVPKRTATSGVEMPRATLREWRDMFPDMTDREIARLWRKTK